jgi:phage terminase large subunit-like protein
MARRARKVEPVKMTVADMFATVAGSITSQAKDPNILGYVPHPKQVEFHKSSTNVTLYIGGNRSGKTVGGVCEDIYRMRGQSPYKWLPPAPTRGRIVCVDFTYGVQQIIIPKLKQWLPPSLLINGSWEDSYNGQLKELTLSNGSTVELMSYEQDIYKFAGTSRDWIHFDEEPPKHIYTECMARLIDRSGKAYLTMTPVEGMTWIYDTLYVPGVEERDPHTKVIIVDITENYHLPEEARDSFLNSLEPDEREARKSGTFVSLGGLVYKTFNMQDHVIDPIDVPKLISQGWEVHESMDHGYNNPTAWLWHLVSPRGRVITFDEHYESGKVVSEHADIVKKKKYRSVFVTADPATAQRNGVTGTSIQVEYAKQGIILIPGNNDVTAGVNRVNSYMRLVPVGKQELPTWQVTSNCVNLINELKRLRWATWMSKKTRFENNPQEKIHKKDDHASDALRYFMVSRPEIKAPPPPIEAPVTPKDTVGYRYDQNLGKTSSVLRERGDIWEISETWLGLESD